MNPNEQNVPTPNAQPQPQFQTAPAPVAQPQPQPQAAPQPTPQAQPAPQPSGQPQPQPQAQPTSPAQQQPTVQGQPQGQPTGQPVQQQPTQLSATPDYDKLLDSYLGKTPTTPTQMPTVPKGDDEAEITKFFEDFAKTIREEAVQTATRQTLTELRQLDQDKVAEQQSWNAVFEKYPHVKDNPNIRQQLHTLRLGAMVSGSNADLTAVADAYFEPQTQQYQQGYQAANQHTYTQRSQHLTAANASTPPQNVATETAYEAMARPGSEGQNAAMLHVQALIDAGKL